MKFLERASLSQPDDRDLKELTREFKNRQKELSAVGGREKQETKQELPDSASPIIKMPSPLPDIVKSNKSVTLHAKRPGMYNAGLQVKRGDFVTILAEGTINVWPARGKERLYGPKGVLLVRFGNKEFARDYGGPEAIEAPEDGPIYIGYKGSYIYFSGNPIKPEHYRDDIGAYNVDVIVWKTKDANLIAKFLEESSLTRPEDKTLKEIVQEFKRWQERTNEAERVQKGLQALKELEEIKRKLSEPVIVVAYPKDGITVESEYVNLFGVAEHEKGISKFEIMINDKPVGLKDQRDLQLVAKDRKRIDFSEQIRLKDGQNIISILVQSPEGVRSQKTISIQLARKREEVYAVVIGINRYKNLPSLKYAANDARSSIAIWLRSIKFPKNMFGCFWMKKLP
jgi:PAS domain-containing protein